LPNFNMSVTVTYYRLPAQVRESVTRDQSSWEEFRRRIQSAHFQSFHSAAAGLEGFSGSREERYAKLVALTEPWPRVRLVDDASDLHQIIARGPFEWWAG
jgi:hypothetical protein